ncbi:Uncharacterised protein [uncultured archaeon]|nr:Uncharacterised protein [uncultured archaeon]
MKKQKKTKNWDSKTIADAEQFEARVLIPGMWRIQARQLMRAAFKLLKDCSTAQDHTIRRLIEMSSVHREQTSGSRRLQGQELEDYEDSNLLPIGLLLAGFAIENQLKGIIFSKNPELLSENLELNKQYTRHELNKLYCAAGFAKNINEIDSATRILLDRLTKAIVWQGRYTFPLHFENFRGNRTIPCNPQKEMDDLLKLYNKLDNTLSQIPIPSTNMQERASGKIVPT